VAAQYEPIVPGTIVAKDPYCEVYKVVFARAEKHGQGILRRRLSGSGHGSTMTNAPREQHMKSGPVKATLVI
jgi:hypothetical protein